MRPGRPGLLGLPDRTERALKIVLGIGAPLLTAVAWGLFLAPRAAVRVPEPFHLILALVVFGAGVAALYVLGRLALALALTIIIIVINRILLYV